MKKILDLLSLNKYSGKELQLIYEHQGCNSSNKGSNRVFYYDNRYLDVHYNNIRYNDIYYNDIYYYEGGTGTDTEKGGRHYGDYSNSYYSDKYSDSSYSDSSC